MNQVSKYILVSLMLLILFSASTGSAQASEYYPNNISSLTSFLSGASYQEYDANLKGSYYVTSLGYEAHDTISFMNGKTTLFTNVNTDSETGKWALVNKVQGTKFFDQTTGLKTGINSGSVQVMELLNPWKVNGMTLNAGTLILGLNDKGSGDSDYDDFILAASKTKPSAHTPIPGAIWLLGSGLVGLFGTRRARRTK